MPGGLHADAKAVGTGEVDGSHGIGSGSGADNESGMLADGQVEPGVRGLVALVARIRRIGRNGFIDVGHHVLGESGNSGANLAGGEPCSSRVIDVVRAWIHRGMKTLESGPGRLYDVKGGEHGPQAATVTTRTAG